MQLHIVGLLCGVTQHFQSLLTNFSYLIMTGRSSNHEKVGKNNLRIVNVQLADAGLYTCVISNSDGTETSRYTATLTVQGKLLQPAWRMYCFYSL